MDKTYVGDPPGWLDQNYTYRPETIKVKRTIRTIETYDAHGKLVSREVITEEEDYYDKQVWPSYQVDVITTTDTTDTTVNKDVPYTLTNGMTVADIKMK